MSIPKTMRALVQQNPQSTNLTLTTVPTPQPAPNTSNEHLIRVHAVAPCAGELLWPKNFPPPVPRDTYIPGPDFAGTVVTAPSSSPFRVGDEVYARANYLRNGAASEYTISVTEEIARRPRGISAVQGTAIPLSSQTAWQALFVQAGVGDLESGNWMGKRVLVTAASGNVGRWVVQLAKIAGATVVGTAGVGNLEAVRSLGADEVLDYRSVDLKEWAAAPGAKVDVVIDCIGRKSLEDAWWAVKDGGTVLSIFQPPNTAVPEGYTGKDVKDLFFIMGPNREHLEAITKLVDEGRVTGLVDSVWPIEQFEEVFKRVEGGRARGKVVIDFALNS
ncbi:NADP-dependent oxidoreductase [Aspergillus lucknowensis]|uniref:Enoyl reductase (ER) domain-containing protein n=1 Tax=Aspergillus lucknowensis TaxID=176173 RepID=A0ABR4M4Y4_9EURO